MGEARGAQKFEAAGCPEFPIVWEVGHEVSIGTKGCAPTMKWRVGQEKTYPWSPGERETDWSDEPRFGAMGRGLSQWNIRYRSQWEIRMPARNIVLVCSGSHEKKVNLERRTV